MHGWTYDYSNYKVWSKIYNYSSNPITITSTNAKLVGSGIPHNPRLRIAGKGSVTIKPYQYSKVIFNVIGTPLYGWFGDDVSFIQCKCVYSGKAYDIRIYKTNYLDGFGGKLKIKLGGKWKKVAGYYQY